MGRGRARAKQAKIAYELKYSGASIDLSQLAEELGASPSTQNAESRDDDTRGADRDPHTAAIRPSDDGSMTR
ncbi:DUF3073 family protein [Streptomyces sp. NPDC018000]|uniref:DUF3073 family protein n=1 Tax=Streptomyces sp. NPDC018000 TaxID=3365028 RepID=UPI0037BCFAE3